MFELFFQHEKKLKKKFEGKWKGHGLIIETNCKNKIRKKKNIIKNNNQKN